MKKLLKRFIPTSLILLLVKMIVGTRMTVHENIKPPALPDDLDLYLKSSEQAIPDLREGMEKTIVWVDPETCQPTDFSIVYLHGFSASRREVAPVCDLMAEKLQANLFYTRLTGHGRSNDAMGEIQLDALLQDAVEAMAIGTRIGKQVILVGTSTGATLACWLARGEYQASISSLIFISPNFGLRQWQSELLLLPWAKSILKFIQGEVYRFKPRNDQQAYFWTTEYPSRALIPMMELVQLVRNTALQDIMAPTLILYSPQDQLVDAKAIEKRFKQIASPIKKIQKIKTEPDSQQHVIAGDILSPDTTQQVVWEILSFINRLR